MKQLLVRGVPTSPQRGGWWMDTAIQPYQPSDRATSGSAQSGAYPRFIMLVCLILLADFLLWGARPGLSLALFGGAVLLACYSISDRRGWGGLCLGIASGLPMGIVLFFVVFLIMAKLVLSRFAQGMDVITAQSLSCVVFWLGISTVLWPALRISDPVRDQTLPVSPLEISLPVRPSFLNQASIGRSLSLFNLIFGAHTLLDAAYPMGGINLPDDMSYADYAHYGAGWLIRRASLLTALLLYGRKFVSFDRSIAHCNLTRDVPPGASYFCGLGAAALPDICQLAPNLCDGALGAPTSPQTNWREWGFRDWRVLRSLAAMTTTISGR